MDKEDIIKGQKKLEERLFSYSQDDKNLDISRRSFVKYAAAGVVAIGAAAAGFYYRRRKEETITPQPPTTIQTAESVTTTEKTKTNKPPEFPLTCEREGSPPILICKETFEIWPKYINPTTEYEIKLSHNAYDPDGDPLTTTWLIDGKEVSHEPKYSTKLPEGEHLIGLRVSDGMEERDAETRVTVEPDQMYPEKPLYVKYKGIKLLVGPIGEWLIRRPNEEEMDEQLSIIHDDLGCNAVIISGGESSEDMLIKGGEISIEKGFEKIYIQPRYMHNNIDETIRKIGEFAKKVKILREKSRSIVYNVGNEFGLETSGIIPGYTWNDRVKYCMKNPNFMIIWKRKIPEMFKKILSICKENYGYEISYAAICNEVDLVPWSDPIFESVCVNALLQEKIGWTTDWLVDLLVRLKKKYKKPVHSSEWGFMTYTGAGELGGIAQLPIYMKNKPYDEDEQANYIKKYCDKVLNKAKIEGSFYIEFNSDWNLTYALLHNGKRKKGYYMYKSYEIVS